MKDQDEIPTPISAHSGMSINLLDHTLTVEQLTVLADEFNGVVEELGLDPDLNEEYYEVWIHFMDSDPMQSGRDMSHFCTTIFSSRFFKPRS